MKVVAVIPSDVTAKHEDVFDEGIELVVWTSFYLDNVLSGFLPAFLEVLLYFLVLLFLLLLHLFDEVFFRISGHAHYLCHIAVF